MSYFSQIQQNSLRQEKFQMKFKLQVFLDLYEKISFAQNFQMILIINSSFEYYFGLHQMNDDDPSLVGGYVEVFQSEQPFIVSSHNLQFSDMIMIRLFQSSSNYKLELTSETNLNFYYKSIFTPNSVQKFTEGNQLKTNYIDFPVWMREVFRGEYQYNFQVKSNKIASIQIIKAQEFKNYFIASLDVQLAPDHELRESFMFRYEKMKIRKNILEDYWSHLIQVLKTKSPSLYGIIVKGEKKKNC